MTWISKTSTVALIDEIFYSYFFNPGFSTYEKLPTKWSVKHRKYLSVWLRNNFLSKSNCQEITVHFNGDILVQAKLCTRTAEKQ